MALVAHRIMVAAEGAFGKAEGLAEGMEPHLRQRISQSQIYQYTTKRDDRNVPPGDVLLAAALAAGISLDRELGLARQSSDIEEMRAEIAEQREELASLRAEMTHLAAAAERPSTDLDVVRAEQAAQRQAWADASRADEADGEPTRVSRRTGRGPRP